MVKSRGWTVNLTVHTEVPSSRGGETVWKCAPVRFGWETSHLDNKGCVWQNAKGQHTPNHRITKVRWQ